MAETALDLYEANSNMFLGSNIADIVKYDSPKGEEVEIHGARIPLLNEGFNLSVVQPGSVQNDPELRPYVGKIRMKFGDSVKEDEFLDTMDLLPICIISYGFNKFGEYGKGKDNSLLCHSSNGLYPSAKYIEHAPSPKCAEMTKVNGEVRLTPVCPHAMWVNNEKPACTQNVRVAFLKLPDCIPLYMQLHGVGFSAFNAFKRQMKKAANVARIRKRDLSRYIIRLSTEDKGTYIVPSFTFTEAPEQYGNMDPYYSIARYFRDSMFSPRNNREEVESSEESTESVASSMDADGGVEDIEL